MALRRSNNPAWKGGRTISSHGYVLIKVDEPQHQHLIQKNLYAYEHQVVMEKKIGRKLRPGEIVHHINGNKQDNRPENLSLKNNIAAHCYEHRKINSDRRKPAESNRVVSCACNCGGKFNYYDDSGRPRKYISSHNPRISPVKDAVILILKNGAAHRKYISTKCGYPLQAISTVLMKLRRKNVARQISGGMWALLSVEQKSMG